MTRSGSTLVALEGIDGSGKSTLARSLVRRANRRGRRTALWREPTDLELGRRAQEASRRRPSLAALLFTLDRAIHRPQLEALLARGDVVADRSFYSTLAYQGSGLTPGPRRTLARMQRDVALVPDQVILLDVVPVTALRRVGRRASSRSPLERLATLQRVARAYRQFARKGRWIVLDAERPEAELVVLAERALAARRRATRRRRT